AGQAEPDPSGGLRRGFARVGSRAYRRRNRLESNHFSEPGGPAFRQDAAQLSERPGRAGIPLRADRLGRLVDVSGSAPRFAGGDRRPAPQNPERGVERRTGASDLLSGIPRGLPLRVVYAGRQPVNRAAASRFATGCGGIRVSARGGRDWASGWSGDAFAVGAAPFQPAAGGWTVARAGGFPVAESEPGIPKKKRRLQSLIPQAIHSPIKVFHRRKSQKKLGVRGIVRSSIVLVSVLRKDPLP